MTNSSYTMSESYKHGAYIVCNRVPVVINANCVYVCALRILPPNNFRKWAGEVFPFVAEWLQ